MPIHQNDFSGVDSWNRRESNQPMDNVPSNFERLLHHCTIILENGPGREGRRKHALMHLSFLFPTVWEGKDEEVWYDPHHVLTAIQGPQCATRRVGDHIMPDVLRFQLP